MNRNGKFEIVKSCVYYRKKKEWKIFLKSLIEGEGDLL